MFYLMTLSAVAQGTPADYARAVGLRDKYEGAAVDITGTIAPIGQTHRFWYRKSVKDGNQFLVIDADTQQKQPAFDHERIARSLSAVTGGTYTGLQLPFNSLVFNDDGSSFTVTVNGASFNRPDSVDRSRREPSRANNRYQDRRNVRPAIAPIDRPRPEGRFERLRAHTR